MKKIIFGGIAVLIIGTAMVLNVTLTKRNSNIPDITLKNIEALCQSSYECIAPWDPICNTDFGMTIYGTRH